MVHGLNGHERTPHLKNAVLCSTTTPPAVQTLRTKAEMAIKLYRPNTTYEQAHNENRDRVV